jgi:hypothetical protein
VDGIDRRCRTTMLRSARRSQKVGVRRARERATRYWSSASSLVGLSMFPSAQLVRNLFIPPRESLLQLKLPDRTQAGNRTAA